MKETTARPDNTNGTVHAFAAMQAGAAPQPHEFVPKSLDPMGVEIQITHCGMCHTDLHLINNDFGFSSYPLVPGHEIAGIVTRLGGASSGLNVGQRVGVGWLAGACMVCEQCTAGHDKIQTMLEFSARHRIKPQIELFPMHEANRALERLRANQMRYRAVLTN